MTHDTKDVNVHESYGCQPGRPCTLVTKEYDDAFQFCTVHGMLIIIVLNVDGKPQKWGPWNCTEKKIRCGVVPDLKAILVTAQSNQEQSKLVVGFSTLSRCIQTYALLVSSIKSYTGELPEWIDK